MRCSLWTAALDGAKVRAYGAGDHDRVGDGAGGDSSDDASVAEFLEDGQRPRVEQEDYGRAVRGRTSRRGDRHRCFKILIGYILPETPTSQ